MSSQNERRDPLSPLIDIFAFFAAARNYGYLDALGNALERTTALEALANAIRDFRSTCLDSTPEERKKQGCPDISEDELYESVTSFGAIMASKESKGELVLFLREVYVKALARASRFKVKG